MTLKQKFKKATSQWFNTKECEEIAEDFALKFAEFLEGRDLYLERKTIDQALNDFKKEKGL